MKDKGKANKLYIQEQERAGGDDSRLTSIFRYKISKICKKEGEGGEGKMEQSKVKKLIPLGVEPNTAHWIA